MGDPFYDLGTLPAGPRCFEASELRMQPGFWPLVLKANGILWTRRKLDTDGAMYQRLDGTDKLLISND